MNTYTMRDNKRYKVIKVIEGFICLLSYLITFLIVQYFFNILIIKSEYKVFYLMLTPVLVYTLNKTLAKIILDFTIPITAITFGLFYFFINAVIIKLVGLILHSKVDLISFWKIFLLSILISSINLLIELVLIKPFVRRMKQ